MFLRENGIMDYSLLLGVETINQKSDSEVAGIKSNANILDFEDYKGEKKKSRNAY